MVDGSRSFDHVSVLDIRNVNNERNISNRKKNEYTKYNSVQKKLIQAKQRIRTSDLDVHHTKKFGKKNDTEEYIDRRISWMRTLTRCRRRTC